jgi:3',5'-cyclic-AMP phosphodiesterase
MGAIGIVVAAMSCIRFSPFQVDVDVNRRDQNAKNLTQLASLDREPVSPERPLVLAFLSDTHDGYSDAEGIVRGINARDDVELVLHAGDFTDFGTSREYEWFFDAMAGLRPPMVVATGNHDALSQGIELYSRALGPANFAFVHANVKFVFFDSNPIEHGEKQPDWPWLDHELSNVEGAARVIAVTHQPPDTDAFLPEDREYNAELQRTRGTFLYLYGHVHDGWLVRRDGPVTYVKTRAALLGSWMVVTTDGERIWLERCHLASCEPKEEVP